MISQIFEIVLYFCFQSKSTMLSKKIEVKGLQIRLESVKDNDYISLTDIARRGDSKPDVVINSWMKNLNTLEFLEEWELLKNPNFNPRQMAGFKEKYLRNRSSITPKRWIEELEAIGIISKPGRYGGTFAHKDIALQFCGWLSPKFQVYMMIKFQELIEEQYRSKNLKWHISKITDNVDEIRNLLDTIPGQNQERNRLNFLKDEE